MKLSVPTIAIHPKMQEMGPTFEEFQIQLERQKSLNMKMQTHMVNVR